MWEAVRVSGTAKLDPRQNHIMESFDHKVYIYGGTTEEDVRLDKMHLFNPEDSRLKVIYASDGLHFGKASPMVKILNKKLVLLSHVGGSTNMDDIRYLDLTSVEDSNSSLVSRMITNIPKAINECVHWIKGTQKGVDVKVAAGELEKLLKVNGPRSRAIPIQAITTQAITTQATAIWAITMYAIAV